MGAGSALEASESSAGEADLTFPDGPASGFTSLARLAVETGGRFTERTNDLSLGYARAQRDLTCVYALGFYVEADDDELSAITVRILRPGVRAVHPGRYRFRSDTERRTSLLRAAWAAPELFQTGVVRAHVFPLRPASGSTWDALFAVSFPVPLIGKDGAPAEREFGAVLAKRTTMGGESVMMRFDRRITLEPIDETTRSTPVVTFLQRLRISPGRYKATAVMTEPGEAKPDAVGIEIEVPEIPRKELFLVGPLLGRASGPNLVVLGGGTATHDRMGEQNTFEPLLIQQVDEAADLVAVTQACLVGSKKLRGAKKGATTPRVVRSLTRGDGEAVGTLAVEPLALEGAEKILCQNLVDVLPAAAIDGGDYVFEAELRGNRGSEGDRSLVRFSVGPPTRPVTDEAATR